MPFLRSDRNDRRRRVMREAVAADAGVAVESVRARQRKRLRRDELESEPFVGARRDPGYSQSVRRACQQRLVQLIPVRRGTLALVMAAAVGVWSVLVLGHYFAYLRPIVSSPLPPLAALLHLRSSHGIAHWLGSQLWMLTALAAIMIFQLRRHKLDDYRARYRVWGVLAAAALFASLDVSSSALQLVGMSLDGWARREVGYSGWAVVLATFATLVGILGLRICGEIRSAPVSVGLWLVGLVAWATSALLGTGMIVVPWTQATTDFVVGSSWLGGIMSVFLAAGVYLRHIYIEAQKRFLLRNRFVSQRRTWKLPRFSRREETELQEEGEESDASVESSGRRRAPRDDSDRAVEDRPKRSWFGWRRRSDESQTAEGQAADGDETPRRSRIDRPKNRVDERDSEREEDISRSDDRSLEREENRRAVQSRRPWLRLPRWRSDPRLGEDYSDVAAERRKRDEGFGEPLTKRRGWFSRKDRSGTSHESSDAGQSESIQSRRSRQTSHRAASNQDADLPDFQEVETRRQSWWKRKKKVDAENRDGEAAPKRGRRWNPLQRRRLPAEAAAGVESSSATPSRKSSVEKSEVSTGSKRRMFGLFDRLKLKPPADSKASSGPVAVQTKSAPLPSSSSAQRHESSKPTGGAHYENRSQTSYDDEDYEEDSSQRSLSKAERKRLRRQQQENRRAA